MADSPAFHEHAPKPNATRARQGRLGRPVLIVLVVSTVLAAIVLFFTWGSHAPELAATEPPSAATGDTATFNAPEPAPKQVAETPPDIPH